MAYLLFIKNKTNYKANTAVRLTIAVINISVAILMITGLLDYLSSNLSKNKK